MLRPSVQCASHSLLYSPRLEASRYTQRGALHPCTAATGCVRFTYMCVRVCVYSATALSLSLSLPAQCIYIYIHKENSKSMGDGLYGAVFVKRRRGELRVYAIGQWKTTCDVGWHQMWRVESGKFKLLELICNSFCNSFLLRLYVHTFANLIFCHFMFFIDKIMTSVFQHFWLTGKTYLSQKKVKFGNGLNLSDYF